MNEVGPNDPNRGRSSIGGFKMPMSKPIEVRDLNDVHMVRWGGFRKPKRKDERKPSATSDLTGGGYTTAQTNVDRGKFLLIFLGAPIVIFSVIGVLGWMLRDTTDPRGSLIEAEASTCTFVGPNHRYTGTFESEPFSGLTFTRFTVTFIDSTGRTAGDEIIRTIPLGGDDIEVRGSSGDALLTRPVTCEVRATNIAD